MTALTSTADSFGIEEIAPLLIVLTGTALEVMKNPKLLEKCKRELKEKFGDDVYQFSIPKEVVPASKQDL